MSDIILTRRRDKRINNAKNDYFTYCVKSVSKREGKTIVFNSFYDKFTDATEALIARTRLSLG